MIKQVLQEKYVVSSKLIEYLIYDHQTKLLQVKYKSGKNKGELKSYKNVDSSAVDVIVQSESPGKALMSILKQIKAEQEEQSMFAKIKSIFS